MSKVKVLVAGSIGLDDVSTPFGSVKDVPGGSATFASLASSIFSKTAMMGVIGKDFPKEKLSVFKEKKIDLSALQENNKPTMRWKAHYGLDINVAHTDVFEANALAEFNAKVPEKFGKIDYTLIGNFDPEQQLSLLNSFEKKPKVSVSDTIEYYIKNKKEKVLEVIKETTIALMNDSEARMIFDTTNLAKAAQEILKLDSSYAIIKKGEHGCLMFSKDSHFSCIGYPLENVKDPTGCGDSFAGAFIGYLASTGDFSEKNLRKAIVNASAVASFNAESFSFEKLSQITKKDVKERVKEFKEFVKF